MPVRPSRRLALSAATALALLVPTAGATAATMTVAADAATITVTGAGGIDLQLTGSVQDGDLDFSEFNGTKVSPGPGCSYPPDYDPQQGTNFVTCPRRPNLVLNADGGNDTIRVIEGCFASATLNVGDGANTVSDEAPSGCAGGTLTFTGGSGQDSFSGSSSSPTRDVFNGGGGDDFLNGAAGDDVLHGNDGNDDVRGADGNDQLFGDAGDDKLQGGFGNDAEDGGDGNDVVGRDDDDQGADDLHGGAGSDVLDLYSHRGGMAIVMDDAANDGAPGEGDNIHTDFESIDGTLGNDTYTGSAGVDVFNGEAGADTIHGMGGNDVLHAGSDGDQLFGDDGNDTLYGDAGDDIVDGGAGTDSIFGDDESCTQRFCASGNDQISSRDGAIDQVNCGSGADIATVDVTDVTAMDGFQACESVDKAGPAPTGVGANQLPAGAAIKLKGKPSVSKGLKVALKCEAACSGKAVLAVDAKTAKKLGLGKKTTLGQAKGALIAPGTTTLSIKLSAKARVKLRRARSVKATLTVTVTDAAGTRSQAKAKVKLAR